jgi:DNA-directed RNA polymerase specialized sigma24 family protein
LQQIIRSDDARFARPVDGGRRLRWEPLPVLEHVYGAALAASSGPAAAGDATRDVMVAAAGQRFDVRALVARVIVRAVRTAPHAAFAPMPDGDREVVALARLGGYSVAEIAEALGIAPAEARSRMTSGLRAVAVN